MSLFNYAVVGAGKQGTASAYDFTRFGKAKKVTLFDINENVARESANRINHLLNTDIVTSKALNVIDSDNLISNLKEMDAIVCAVPYRFNLDVTKAAIEAGTSMTDLGGHTDNVRKQLNFHKAAKSTDISIVPDCGMGPGMNITLALLAMEQMDEPKHVSIWDGGLPLNPKPPWNYQILFDINGLTNEYFGNAYFLDNGNLTEVACFERREFIDFSGSIGKLEAAVTSGGLSTMPWTFENKLQTLENKTLRYPGHWEWMSAYRQLGLFNEEAININGHSIIPREFYHHLLQAQLELRDVRDLCIMRIQCIGKNNGIKYSSIVDTVEYYDSNTGFTAMEKWTGWHASIIAILAAQGKIKKGVISVENALSGSCFLKEVTKRGYEIKIKNEQIDG